jgi:hypothetical protein
MKRLIMATLLALLLNACSKKHQPQTAVVMPVADNASANPVIAAAKKAPVRKTIKTAVPKVITVDHRAAHVTPDGRHYYDLEGKRYWRNYKDGKYYLYHKSMYSNPAFKPQ